MKSIVLALTLLSSILSGVVIGLVSRQADEPQLIGRGCDGSSGALYAYEEDHFPRWS